MRISQNMTVPFAFLNAFEVAFFTTSFVCKRSFKFLFINIHLNNNNILFPYNFTQKNKLNRRITPLNIMNRTILPYQAIRWCRSVAQHKVRLVFKGNVTDKSIKTHNWGELKCSSV